MSLEQLSKTVDFVQATTPSNANDGETYLDTSQSPPQLKVFDSSANAFVRPRSIQNLDAPVSEAGASAEVKRLDLRFVREMSRLFFDRSLAALNFSEGTFEIFADTNNISTSPTVLVKTGTNGQALIGTDFDIATASFAGTTLNAQDGFPTGVTFSADGTTMIEVGSGSDQFYEYSLNTAFDIATASFTGTTLNTQDGGPRGVTFSADGTTMIEIGAGSGQFYEYSLNTAFDIATASFTGTTLNTQDSFPRGVTFSADGTTMIEIGNDSDQFYEYDGALSGTTGTGTVSKSVTLGFTPTTAVVEDTTENGLNASYDITDGNGNTVSVSQSEVGTTVDCSALTDGSLTVTANLDNPTTAANALRDFAVYFD